MNDAPVARQSRGTARPQAGESTFPHQNPECKSVRDFILWKAINLITKVKLTRILFTTEIIAQMFDAVKRFNKNLVKKIDTNKYVGYDEKNNWGGACV